MAIAHFSLYTKDYESEKNFLLKALAPLGYTIRAEYGKAAGFFDGHDTDFWLHEDERAFPCHVAYVAKSKEEVEAFYEAALAAGGEDNGKPGYREYWPGYYAAFVYDPSGNNLEAVYYDYEYNKAHS